MMFGFKRVVIGQMERGFKQRNRRFAGILGPGVYWRFDPLSRVRIDVHDLREPRFSHELEDALIREAPETVAHWFVLADLGSDEVGLVYVNDKLSDVLAPSSRTLFWKGPAEVRVERIDIGADPALPAWLARQLAFPASRRLGVVAAQAVTQAEVADGAVGLLFVDGELARTLDAGLHAFWRYNRSVRVEQIPLREQLLEVSGQEILTKDKVSLRVNLSAAYRVTDAVTARTAVDDYVGFVYRTLQFALRQAIGTRNLDALLGNKGELDRRIHEAVVERAAEIGVEVKSAGVRDLILPGDMKTILNRVVEAEKEAQANVIRRREETAANRSQLNTAKLMDEHPSLRRLKELEVLEKVTEKVDRLTVFGGLDGVMSDVVKMNVS